MIVPVGQPGQYLQLSESGIPVWTGSQFASLTTTDASSITTTSAVTGGFISGNGGSPITAAGICYGKAHNPTTANNVVPDTTRLGQFSLTLTGLTASTTYYARAYAVTSVGTSYGNEITITTPAPIVGDTYQGGIIAYIFQSTDPGYVAGETHGLVVAPNDQGSGITWGCTGTYIGCPATGIGSGAANTAMIVNGCAEAVTAARVCSDLVLNGYSDWFLPSKDELMMAYTNLHTHGLGGFGYVHYWTSSETNANSATKVDFLVGSPTGSTKSYTNKSVRAMRQF